MPKRTTSIPVNYFGGEHNAGVFIEKIAFSDLPNFSEWGQPERHDRHSFFFLEKGAVTIEIDFKKYKVKPGMMIYMHPSQVHRIVDFRSVTVACIGIDNTSLNPVYLKLLEELTPAKPLLFDKESFAMIAEAVRLSLKYSSQKGKLQAEMLKDSCNALIGFVISRYMEQARPKGRQSRFEVISKAFRESLERNFMTMKSPTAYAQQLNISTPYLNECVKNTTGHSVSYHIQQRVVLEARRLLYHSDKSVKEIARELGYDDYPYFSRLFTKVTGVSALTFRNKNRD